MKIIKKETIVAHYNATPLEQHIAAIADGFVS